MRRGLGVAHVQQRQEMQTKMAEFGEQITAQRVGQIADQLESLERQLRDLANKFKEDIKHDPVVRARFRQLADSLGVDLISSKKNVFSGALGLGDFYFALASKVVEACLREEKFCGAFVPLRRVLDYVQRSYDATLTSNNEHDNNTHAHNNEDDNSNRKSKKNNQESIKRTVISREDVLTALKKLEVFGTGYDVVEINGVSYVQTSADGTRGNESIPLLNYVIQVQEEQLMMAKSKAMHEHSTMKQNAAVSSLSSLPLVQSSKNNSNNNNTSSEDYTVKTTQSERSDKETELDVNQSIADAPHERMRLGVAYLLKSDIFDASKNNLAQYELSDMLQFKASCVALTAEQICDELHWPMHRTQAVLDRLVQNGTVWIDYANINENTLHGTQNRKSSSQQDKQRCVVYWFTSIRHDDVPSAKNAK